MKIISQTEFDAINPVKRNKQLFNGIITYLFNSDNDSGQKHLHRFINPVKTASDAYIISNTEADAAYFWLCDQIEQADDVTQFSAVRWVVDVFAGFDEDFDDLEDD